MPWRYTLAAPVAALLFIGVAAVPGPRAERLAAPSAAPGQDAGSPVRLLERHGEPALAWDRLQRQGGPRNDAEYRLAVRLLTELGRYAEADSMLAGTPPGLDPAAAFRLRLQRARLNLEAGNPARAVDLLSHHPSPDAALNAYASYVLVRAHLALGDGAAAASVLEQVDAATLPDALREPFAEQRVSVYRELGRTCDAMRAASAAAQQAGDVRTRRELLLSTYRLAWECGDAASAMRAARTLCSDQPSSEEAGEVARDLVVGSRSQSLSAFMLLSCADVLATNGDEDTLRRALRMLDKRELGVRESEEHRLLWAEYHYQSGDYSRAIALARPSYSDQGLRRRSMLVMARSLRKLGKRSEAAAMYEAFVHAYPNDALAAEALYAAGSLYQQDNRAGDRARVLDQLRRAYPSTFHGWAAAMRRAGDFAVAGDGAQAAAIYEQWLARSRRTDEAALFYLARERERESAGSGAMILDELRSLNRYSFYVTPNVTQSVRGPLRDSSGSIVREGSGSLVDWLVVVEDRRGSAYDRVFAAASAGPETKASDADGAVERGLFFLEAGLRDWAERELDAARRGGRVSAQNSLMLARLYDEYAMPWQSVRLYERARSSLPWQQRRSFSDDFRVLTYPLPYPAQVLDNAARNGVAPHLIYGMIREESRFEADVVSRAGAVGLMQLMPETARRVAAQLDLATEMGDRLDEPAVNVSLGVWYAADLLRAGQGSVAWMLAAYNAGPGAATRWIDPGVAGEPAIDAVESIDYKETRGYVKRVVESANVYQSLYFSGTR
jgi:soluble lytic murein transglycosylase